MVLPVFGVRGLRSPARVASPRDGLSRGCSPLLIPLAGVFCGLSASDGSVRGCLQVGPWVGISASPPVAPTPGKCASPGWEMLPQREQLVLPGDLEGFIPGILLALGTVVWGCPQGAPAWHGHGCRKVPGANIPTVRGSRRRRWPQAPALSSGRILQSPEGFGPGSAPSPPHSFACNPLIVSKKST